MKTALLMIMPSGPALADMNNIITLVQGWDVRMVRIERNMQLRRALREYVKTDHPTPDFWEATQ